jgi:4,5-dihydroxyphthalate decarboxylase
VLGEKSDHPDLKPLFADVAAEERAWFEKHGVVPINHMVVVSRTLSEQYPDVAREVHRLLAESAAASSATPRFSSDEMRRSLELIVNYSTQQKLIPRAYAVEELLDDVTRALW